MSAFMGAMPVPVAKTTSVGYFSAGARSTGKPLPITGLTSTASPTHKLLVRLERDSALICVCTNKQQQFGHADGACQCAGRRTFFDAAQQLCCGPLVLDQQLYLGPLCCWRRGNCHIRRLAIAHFHLQQIVGTTSTQGLTTSVSWTANLWHLLCTLFCAALAHTAVWRSSQPRELAGTRASSVMCSHQQPPERTGRAWCSPRRARQCPGAAAPAPRQPSQCSPLGKPATPAPRPSWRSRARTACAPGVRAAAARVCTGRRRAPAQHACACSALAVRQPTARKGQPPRAATLSQKLALASAARTLPCWVRPALEEPFSVSHNPRPQTSHSA